MLSLVVIRAQDIDRLGSFYTILGCCFARHRHNNGPEHLSSTMGGMVFEIYPVNGAKDKTISTRLGFSVTSLATALNQLREAGASVLTEPADTPFGRRAVVKDFEGHKVELYEQNAG